MNRLPLLLVLAFLALPCALSAQVINGDFEVWDSTASGRKPLGWNVDFIGSTRSSDASKGDYAITMWNWYYYGRGYIVLGDKENVFWLSYDQSGVPIANKPARLTGHYKYILGANQGASDSAKVLLLLKRHNHMTGGYDSVGYAEALLPAADAYTPFQLNIADLMPGVMPDSISLTFVSSDHGFCGPESDGTCCYFSVDNLQLSTAAGVAYDMSALTRQASVYPNPVTGAARIVCDPSVRDIAGVHIYAADGRQVRVLEAGSGEEILFQRAGLPGGAYSFEVRDRSDRVVSMGRFVVQ